MRLVAGFLSDIIFRSLRYSGARDVAYLLETINGYTNNIVRQFLGYTARSFTIDITESYAGNLDREIYNNRVTREYNSRFDRDFAIISGI